MLGNKREKYHFKQAASKLCITSTLLYLRKAKRSNGKTCSLTTLHWGGGEKVLLRHIHQSVPQLRLLSEYFRLAHYPRNGLNIHRYQYAPQFRVVNQNFRLKRVHPCALGVLRKRHLKRTLFHEGGEAPPHVEYLLGTVTRRTLRQIYI